jgi:hypothetical protein
METFFWFEVLVLKKALTIPALAAILVTASVRAQTYDPSYPICLHVYGDLEGERIDCIYTSLEQCRAAAMGRAAMCEVNPNFARAAQMPPGKAARRKH